MMESSGGSHCLSHGQCEMVLLILVPVVPWDWMISCWIVGHRHLRLMGITYWLISCLVWRLGRSFWWNKGREDTINLMNETDQLSDSGHILVAKGEYFCDSFTSITLVIV